MGQHHIYRTYHDLLNLHEYNMHFSIYSFRLDKNVITFDGSLYKSKHNKESVCDVIELPNQSALKNKEFWMLFILYVFNDAKCHQ